jgi:peptidoglycan/xylan/chitin deacetylase (PgdA/CDA1 family)
MPDAEKPSQAAQRVVNALIAGSLGLAIASPLLLAGCAPESKPATGDQAAASAKPGDDAAGRHVQDGDQVASADKGDQTAAKPANAAAFAKANELGLVPVLEYHRFGPKEERWTRTPENFRKDLEWLYNNDYVLVNMADVAEKKFDLPAGKKPVVLTFDDSTEGQLRYLKGKDGKFQKGADGKYVIDPNCAIGMIDAFYAKHPDFGRAGTFYVLPSGFDQDGVIADKFKYLVATGRELGNHTWAHENMSGMSAGQVNTVVGKLNNFISQQLGTPYTVKTLALPFGIGPRSDAGMAAVVKGGAGGNTYYHKAVMLVGANPNVSPYDKKYKPTAVARIQAIDSEFRNWFNRKPGSTAKGAEPWVPYVSDGDASLVTFPVSAKDKLNPNALLPNQKANPFDPKAQAAAVHEVRAAEAGQSVAAKPETQESPSAAPAASEAPQASESAAPVVTASASAAPKVSTATDVHPGYNVKLPAGAKYDNGKITHTVRAGDSVEAIAYKLVRFTDYYTYPKLASAIRSENKLTRPLKIGETLVIPNVRQNAPVAKMVPKPKNFDAKGVYVTGTTAGSEMLWSIVKDLKAHGGNTIVFDAKDMNGKIAYKSNVPLAKEIGAYQGDMISDLPKMIERLHNEGIHVATRLTLFHDQRLATRKPQYALRSKSTGRPWLENGHLLWVDSSIPAVQDYNLALAKELIANGVDEIQYDYVRFPAMGGTHDIAWSTMKTQTTKDQVITAWVKRAYETLHPTGALISADVYGVVAWDQGIDVRITGQKLEDMCKYLDALSPMLYPSHFYPPFDGFKYPAWEPYYFVHKGVLKSLKKTEGSGVAIRPWIQAFPYMVKGHYNEGYVATQLKASEDANGTGWLLWNAENNYKVGFGGVSQYAKMPKGKQVAQKKE